MATTVARNLGLAALLVLMTALGWLASLSVVHAQQLPAHVFFGEAFIDGNLAPDRTTVSAWIDGHAVAKATVEGGKYTLMVEPPHGQSYTGKTVTYQVGEVQTGERRKWEQGGTTVVNLNADILGAGGRLPSRMIGECVVNVLGRVPSRQEDMTPQELSKTLEVCPGLKELMGALTSGGRDDRLLQMEILEQELRQTEEEIRQLEWNMPREIQQELDHLDRQLGEIDRQLWDDLQGQLDHLDRRRFDIEREFEEQLRTADIRRYRDIEMKFRREFDGLERERFELERRTQNQIQQKLSNLERERQDRERELWDEKERNLNRLDQRRFELEGALEQQRIEMERQLMEQERQLMEQERQRRERERLDREFGQERSSIGDPGGGPKPPTRGLTTRGFFTNSASGSVSDLNKFMDPTTLAVVGILLTLVASSIPLVKGN